MFGSRWESSGGAHQEDSVRCPKYLAVKQSVNLSAAWYLCIKTTWIRICPAVYWVLLTKTVKKVFSVGWWVPQASSSQLCFIIYRNWASEALLQGAGPGLRCEFYPALMQSILFSSYFISVCKNFSLVVDLIKTCTVLLKNSSGYDNNVYPSKNFPPSFSCTPL